MLPNRPLVIASRGSKLALWQAEFVKRQLTKQGYEAKIKVISTKGDRVRDRFLHEMGGKGLFVKELELAMQRGEADLAVHSLKDLPAILPEEFELASVLPRHSPFDVLILREEILANWPYRPKKITPREGDLLSGLKIGTASLRRHSLIKSLGFPIDLAPLRGNVDTRIEKLKNGEFDAIILAEAALERLGYDDLPAIAFDHQWFVPSPAQGALAIECLKEHPVSEALYPLDDPLTREAVLLERQVLADLGGDCTMPIGCYCDGSRDQPEVFAKVLDYEGQEASCVFRLRGLPRKEGRERDAQAIIGRLKEEGLLGIMKAISGKVPDLGRL